MKPAISAEQRYRNAVRKARIRSERDLRSFLAGTLEILSTGHFERDELIAAISRAYCDGARDQAEAAR